MLAVVALLLVLADRAAHHREVGALRESVQQGRAASVYADRRLAGTVQYASGQLTSASAPPAVRADLRRLVQQEAAGQVPALRRARDRVAAVPVVPWHRSAVAARRAAARHLDVRVQHLQDVARDVALLYGPRPDVDRSAERARAALAALLPAAEAEALYR